MKTGEDRPGREGSRLVLGSTEAGRYLRVVYVPDPEITEYELSGKPLAAYRSRRKKKRQMMRQTRYPQGWNEERVKQVLHHYEQQSEEEAVAEDEAALEQPSQTMIEVPRELVPAIRELIAKHEKGVSEQSTSDSPPERSPR